MNARSMKRKLALAPSLFILAAATLGVTPGYAAQQVLNVGAAANDGTGDPLRSAMIKANANFSDLYGCHNLVGGSGISISGCNIHLSPDALAAAGMAKSGVNNDITALNAVQKMSVFTHNAASMSTTDSVFLVQDSTMTMHDIIFSHFAGDPWWFAYAAVLDLQPGMATQGALGMGIMINDAVSARTIPPGQTRMFINDAVGYWMLGLASADGAKIWGGNTALADHDMLNHTFNGAFLLGFELDETIFGTNTTVNGWSLILNGYAQPTAGIGYSVGSIATWFTRWPIGINISGGSIQRGGYGSIMGSLDIGDMIQPGLGSASPPAAYGVQDTYKQLQIGTTHTVTTTATASCQAGTYTLPLGTTGVLAASGGVDATVQAVVTNGVVTGWTTVNPGRYKTIPPTLEAIPSTGCNANVFISPRWVNNGDGTYSLPSSSQAIVANGHGSCVDGNYTVTLPGGQYFGTSQGKVIVTASGGVVTSVVTDPNNPGLYSSFASGTTTLTGVTGCDSPVTVNLGWQQRSVGHYVDLQALPNGTMDEFSIHDDVTNNGVIFAINSGSIGMYAQLPGVSAGNLILYPVGIGRVLANGPFSVGADVSTTNAVAGIWGLRVDSHTYTDTTTSTSQFSFAGSQFDPPTITSTNPFAVIDGATVKISGPPVAGTNVTLNHLWGLQVLANAQFQGVTVTNMPTSAGGGGLYVCVDTLGNTYKKASCP